MGICRIGKAQTKYRRNTKKPKRITRLQILNQLFIAIVSVAVGVALYNGLSLSLIEAVIVSVLIAALCLLALEVSARHRAEARMRAAVEDLSRLLAQNAQAGQVLSSDIQELKALNTDPRLTSLEADVSVLGTIVRQLSETVSEIEMHSFGATPAQQSAPATEVHAPQIEVEEPAPALVRLPLAVLEQAIADGRIEPFMQPIVSLPQRKVVAYELLARLRLDDDTLHTAEEFMPQSGGEKIVPQLDNLMILRAVQIVRRMAARQKTFALHVNLSPLTLSDETVFAKLLEVLAANTALRETVFFEFQQAEFEALSRDQINALEELTKLGFSLILDNVTNLRLDFTELTGHRVRKIKITAAQFLDNARALSDIHIADIVDLLDRHDIDLVITQVEAEQQVLQLLDERISSAIGNHFSEPRPVRSDVLEPEDIDGLEMLPRDVMPQAGE